MEKMPKLGTAIAMAAEVHKNQFDKTGIPYILHCLAVMDMVKDRVKDHNQEQVMIVAVLHDTVEDIKGSMQQRKLEHDIYELFGTAISSAVDALTHQRFESYDEYIKRVSHNWIARVVKICDLTHNMDPRRIPASQIVDKDFQRWDKYRKALIRLEREP